MITSIRNVALTLAAASLVASPVAANVGDSMDRFMDDMGAAANVTGPTAFESAGSGAYSSRTISTVPPPAGSNAEPTRPCTISCRSHRPPYAEYE